MITELNKSRKKAEEKAKIFLSTLRNMKNEDSKKELAKNMLIDAVINGKNNLIDSYFRYPEIYNLIEEETLCDIIKIAPTKFIEKSLIWKKQALFNTNYQHTQRVR